MKKILLLAIIISLFTVQYASAQSFSDALSSQWDSLGNAVNNAFFFVIDKIVDIMNFFIRQAMVIGRVTLLIAILSAALNYALTGTGLKENIIKIVKATSFFFIVIFAYPTIIGFILSWTYGLAEGSVYNSVNRYFTDVRSKIETRYGSAYIGDQNAGDNGYRSYTYQVYSELGPRDTQGLFSNLAMKRVSGPLSYHTIAPATLLKIYLLIAGECIKYSDDGKKWSLVPEFSRVLKGLICAFFIIFTGVFALLEYIICFLEFMLVASVGIILFPLSIWDGSKFLSEKFIGAIIGFAIKLLFCNIAIFLCLYGFISIFYTISDSGFQGTVDQIAFIAFSCMLFFFICKSAPGMAQSLLTGTPSLNAAGAIAAAGGAVAAAGAVGGLAKKVGGTVAGGAAKTGFGIAGGLAEAGAAGKAAGKDVADAGGNKMQQMAAGIGAFGSSLRSDVADTAKGGALGLTRSLLGGGGKSGSGGAGGTNPHSWRQDFLNSQGNEGSQTFGEHFDKRKNEGAKRGHAYAQKK